jgi:hypothetical protein
MEPCARPRSRSSDPMIMPRFLILTLAAVLLAAGRLPAQADGASGSTWLEKVAGDGVSAVAGSAVTAAVRVVRDGAPVPGAPVRFQPGGGTGMVLDDLVRTDETGLASTVWMLGTGRGPQTLLAAFGDTGIAFHAEVGEPEPGAKYFGRNRYVEYAAGELPIVISAPHGGDLHPEAVPVRTWGARGRDGNTVDLARRISDALREATGRRAHLVVLHLRRSGLDANRDLEEAAQGSALAARAWHEYHAWIDVARHEAVRRHGRAFYVDVHGHGHAIQRLELGYLLSRADLNRSDAELDVPFFRSKSSIRSLAEAATGSFAALIRGPESLGEMLVRRGYPTIPSWSDPRPESAPYFAGGYSTVRHGSRGGGAVDGVQLEVNRTVRATEENREAFAHAFADALLDYLEVHAGLLLRAPAVSAW